MHSINRHLPPSTQNIHTPQMGMTSSTHLGSRHKGNKHQLAVSYHISHFTGPAHLTFQPTRASFLSKPLKRASLSRLGACLSRLRAMCKPSPSPSGKMSKTNQGPRTPRCTLSNLGHLVSVRAVRGWGLVQALTLPQETRTQRQHPRKLAA